MNTHSSLRAVALGALLLPALLLVTGCSSLIDEVAHKQKSFSYEDRAAMQKAFDRQQNWVPSDAVDIIGTTSTVAEDTVILVHSGSPLDPALCATAPRESAPAYTLPDAPDIYRMTEVHACGAWSVVPVDGGWLGWTPNSASEAALSPAS